MAITKSEFKQAFDEAVALEFTEILSDEEKIDYSFSDEFLKKMDSLISAQKTASWSLKYFAKRHIAMVAIILLGLFATACGVTQVVKYVHHDIYKEVIQQYMRNGGELNTAAEFHKMTYLPEGFEKISVHNNKGYKYQSFENEKGHEIEFMQDCTGEVYQKLKEELVTRETVVIDGNTVELFQNDWLIGAMWVEDGIYMEILYYDGADMEELKTIVEGVE